MGVVDARAFFLLQAAREQNARQLHERQRGGADGHGQQDAVERAHNGVVAARARVGVGAAARRARGARLAARARQRGAAVDALAVQKAAAAEAALDGAHQRGVALRGAAPRHVQRVAHGGVVLAVRQQRGDDAHGGQHERDDDGHERVQHAEGGAHAAARQREQRGQRGQQQEGAGGDGGAAAVQQHVEEGVAVEVQRQRRAALRRLQPDAQRQQRAAAQQLQQRHQRVVRAQGAPALVLGHGERLRGREPRR
ncbi:hypothetical protein FGB62_35g119 [Gracilaria domingensis]|nr:hypothetical protein FGB62_35g119 [Gracilaria domingensis]